MEIYSDILSQVQETKFSCKDISNKTTVSITLYDSFYSLESFLQNFKKEDVPIFQLEL